METKHTEVSRPKRPKMDVEGKAVPEKDTRPIEHLNKRRLNRILANADMMKDEVDGVAETEFIARVSSRKYNAVST